MILAMIVTTTCTISCSKNDEENAGGSETPTYSPTKHIVKVTHYNFNYNYTYDNKGRVTHIERDGGYSKQYSYDNNTIIETISDIANWQNTYTLENGRIIKVYDGDTKTTDTYSYNNGYLTTETDSKRQIQYEWKDGNLINVDFGNFNATYEYTNYECPQGFFPFGHNAHICENWGMSGYLGKTMKNLPSKYTEYDVVETYDWTVKDGLPIQMIRKIKGGGYNATSTFTFEWE